MNYIYTTPTAVNTIKKAAKRACKDSDLKLHASLEIEAKKAGYADFHHLNLCLKDSPVIEPTSLMNLPKEVAGWFDQYKELCSAETIKEINRSVVFAFDQKDSEYIDENPCFKEIPNAWPYLGQDIAKLSLFGIIDLDNGEETRGIDDYSIEENLEEIRSEVDSYHFYLPVQSEQLTPMQITSFLDKSDVLFWPHYCWHHGRLLDLLSLSKEIES